MLPFQNDTAQIVRAEIAVNALGERRRAWDEAVTVTDVTCNVQPDGTTETRAAGTRNQVVSTYRFWFPPGTDVNQNDRILWQGQTFDVTGKPQVWVLGDGVEHHVELVATTSTG